MSRAIGHLDELLNTIKARNLLSTRYSKYHTEEFDFKDKYNSLETEILSNSPQTHEIYFQKNLWTIKLKRISASFGTIFI